MKPVNIHGAKTGLSRRVEWNKVTLTLFQLFLDQMLKSDENLRVEEVIVPAGFSEQPLDQLHLSGRDHIILALREGDRWTFNPDPAHVIRAGTTFVIMATPEGRKAVEEALGWV
ncbi:MAG: hypothetical protein Q7R45_02845 [Sulfuricaulis sp.]|nr:hypothetical protein [Sulfuricaulis sp.]